MKNAELKVQIVRLLNDDQPGGVEGEFSDAVGRKHRFIDKAPIFGCDYAELRSILPAPGVVRCEFITQWRDDAGRDLVRISTARPDAVDSTEGLSEFVVPTGQLA